MGTTTATRPLQPWTAPTASDPVAATLRLPGSKSMTARALVLSALASGPSTLAGPLRARDTELMAAGLRGMGAHVSISDDERWLVRPHRLVGPAHVDVGLAGTVMRFVPPVAGLAEGRITFDGDPQARTRPLGPLIGALRSLGVRIDVAGPDSLPLTVVGAGRVAGGEVVIDASASSQLVSGLLLAAPRFERGVVVRHVGPPVPSAPHLRMTVQMLRAAGAAVDDAEPDVWAVEPGPLTGRGWEIEPDLSGAVPFFAAALVTGGEVTLAGWPHSSAQPVERLRELLQRMGGEVQLSTAGLTVRGTGTVRGLEADLSDVSELTPALTALAMLADSPSRFTGVAHIRGHETDRIAALAREFTALGADLTESRDGLEIRPRPLRGGTFRTYADHRMAHAAAVAGLAVPGIELDDVACTSKTMPEFPALWSAMVTGKS
ncbi:3-phosphoshikimate 1-carboxyvinyltransferase [Micromonospora globbae]|uniref:3-phosphoshikimate 1-carboxyvinyltransferase n=1 Tax=Micromonospora globbae TaxID=1894969 RepID=A0ABZ1S6S0_9ACTN|nr:3-phosphoshikimate 1-carboxyvinyltransferase [Micromonospora globbae]WTF85396.1 3-phosphoshikimate 1-carboxyvinyltransferase [Micromonospora globbae]